jgi:hypothetical protein
MIDYALAKKQGPKLKAALTRAKGIVNAEQRYIAVRKACTSAVRAWEVWGAWPDGWSLWQRTLDDACVVYAHSGLCHNPTFLSSRLEEL